MAKLAACTERVAFKTYKKINIYAKAGGYLSSTYASRTLKEAKERFCLSAMNADYGYGPSDLQAFYEG